MMTHTNLKQVIRDYIMDIYGKLYVRDIKIINLEPQGYNIKLYIHGSEIPTTIISDLSENEFLKFLKTELKNLKLDRTKHFGVNKIQPIDYIQYPFL